MQVYKKFGELTKEERCELFDDWYNGKQIQHMASTSSGNIIWLDSSHPSWDHSIIYRVALTKSSINWDHVHSDYKWLATDRNGKSFLYTMKPPYSSTYHGSWMHSDNLSCHTSADAYSSFEKGAYGWEDSLVERP